MTQRGKLACEVCGKFYDTLGGYVADPDDHDGTGSKWFMCLRCFGEADLAACKEDRWPGEQDFKRLQNLKRLKASE